jgi:hypothetical protein
MKMDGDKFFWEFVMAGLVPPAGQKPFGEAKAQPSTS